MPAVAELKNRRWILCEDLSFIANRYRQDFRVPATGGDNIDDTHSLADSEELENFRRTATGIPPAIGLGAVIACEEGLEVTSRFRRHCRRGLVDGRIRPRVITATTGDDCESDCQ
jgi:hypothetical protein